MLDAKEIEQCVERGMANIASVYGKEKFSKLVDLIKDDEVLMGFIHSVAMEVTFTAVRKGVAISDKKESILTMPENIPVLVRDEKKDLLMIVVPKGGKYYIVGTDKTLNIEPSCWYNVPLFKPSEEKSTNDESAEQVETDV